MAEKFTQHTGRWFRWMLQTSIPTRSSLPILQKVTRTGFGAHLFNDWRFLDDKGQQPNPEFVLNFPEYRGIDTAGAGKLRLRLARARAVGADRLRL